jgi:hypothetical protein
MSETILPVSVPDALRRFRSSFRLARASELAIAGRLLEAETILTPPESVQEYDLLAKILFRRGLYGSAIKYWNEALKQKPSSATFQLAIDTCSMADSLSQKVAIRFIIILFPSILPLMIFIVRSFRSRSLSSRRPSADNPATHARK